MAKRLFIAFVLTVALTVVCVAVLPRYGLTQLALVPMLAFVVMLVAAIAVEAQRARDDEEASPDESTCGCGGTCDCGDGCGCVDSCRCVKQSAARPIGCCGPRPVGEASRLRAPDRQDGQSGGGRCGCGRSGGCGS
ncbi:hypothetical protein JYU07_00205 [Roseiflexus sp. AH-315-K22]|nr:hypothetical protein [Roseiflexus sp. AH-315-K22]